MIPSQIASSIDNLDSMVLYGLDDEEQDELDFLPSLTPEKVEDQKYCCRGPIAKPIPSFYLYK